MKIVKFGSIYMLDDQLIIDGFCINCQGATKPLTKKGMQLAVVEAINAFMKSKADEGFQIEETCLTTPAAIAPPVAAPDVKIMRPDSRWVEYTLEDGKKAVINAAGEIFMKADVMVAVTVESGGTMQHPSVRTEGYILRHAPVAAGSVDTPEFEKLMVRWSTAGGGRFGLHEQGIPELRAKIVEHIDAWGAQQRELGKQEALDLTVSVGQLRQRAEKAEAELKARDFFVDVLNCQVKKAQGEADVLFHRLNAANGHLAMARERIEELETEIKVLHQG